MRISRGEAPGLGGVASAVSGRTPSRLGAIDHCNKGSTVGQFAEDGPRGKLPMSLNRPTARRILLQRQVRSQFVAIAGVGARFWRRGPHFDRAIRSGPN